MAQKPMKKGHPLILSEGKEVEPRGFHGLGSLPFKKGEMRHGRFKAP